MRKIILYVFVIIVMFLTSSLYAQTIDSLYLSEIKTLLKKEWPANRTINIVFHGHSVPSGYFNTPYVNSLDAYPHLTYHHLKEKYPYAVINVITSSIGGENSKQGALRFESDVLNHKPDVLFIDYSINDRGIGLIESKKAWSEMIEKAMQKGIKVILLTPTPDKRADILNENDPLSQQANQVRELATKYNIGIVDSYALFVNYLKKGENIDDVMSWVNHPNKEGHTMVAALIMKWF